MRHKNYLVLNEVEILLALSSYYSVQTSTLLHAYK